MNSVPIYKRVPVSSLNKRRRGKHHDLIGGILRELESLPAASALQIPLQDIGHITLTNLRSAVHRATNSRGLNVETASDKDHLYIWRPTHNGRNQRR